MKNNFDLYNVKCKIPTTALKLYCFYDTGGKRWEYSVVVIDENKADKILLSVLFVNGATANRINSKTYKRLYPVGNGTSRVYYKDYFVIEKSFYKAIDYVKKYIDIERIEAR